ncbi:MAG: hypothetical protein LBQ97_00635 [Fusobacteriaceae bacterium]|jgi:hypothetical protein|nr:hypothetical protein [Fusobacteriaceae bacterium]
MNPYLKCIIAGVVIVMILSVANGIIYLKTEKRSRPITRITYFLAFAVVLLNIFRIYHSDASMLLPNIIVLVCIAGMYARDERTGGK